MTVESAEDLSWFWRATTCGFGKGIRAEERGERRGKNGEAKPKPYKGRSGVAFRPAPGGTPTIIVLFDQSPPSYLSYGRALGHQVWYVAYAGYTALCCVACSGSSSLWGKISKKDI